MADEDVRTIWRLGEHWRDLRDEVLGAGAVTVVTEQSLYLLDVDAELFVRVAGPHATASSRGPGPARLVSVDVATPCGLVLNRGAAGWALSTRLALVAAGWHDLHTSGLGAELVELVESGTVRFTAGHDGPGCEALWCPVQGPGGAR